MGEVLTDPDALGPTEPPPAPRRPTSGVAREELPLPDRVALLEERGDWIEQEIGRAPRFRGDHGSGLWRAIHALGDRFDAFERKLDKACETIAEREEKERLAEQKRAKEREPFARLLWVAAFAAVAAIVGIGLAYGAWRYLPHDAPRLPPHSERGAESSY